MRLPWKTPAQRRAKATQITKDRLEAVRRTHAIRVKELNGHKRIQREFENRKVQELANSVKSIGGEGHILLPTLSKEDIIEAEATRTRTKATSGAFITASRELETAQKELFEAQVNELLHGAKKGRKITLRSKKRKSGKGGNDYTGNFVGIDPKQKLIILHDPKVNTDPTKQFIYLHADRIQKRVK